MPLTTLNTVDPSKADAILATAVLSLGGADIERAPSELDQLAGSLIKDAQNELRLGSSEPSAADVDRIRAYLAEEVSRRLRAGQNMSSVEERLGERGSLPNGAYKVSVSDRFKKIFKDESEKFAKLIVGSPDKVEHIFVDDKNEDDPQVSLYAKVAYGARKRPHWVVAVAARRGASVSVDAVFRVFPERITKPLADTSPTVLLNELLSLYGLRMSVNGLELPKGLVVDLDIPFKDGSVSIEYDRTPEAGYIDIIVAGQEMQQRVAFGLGVDMKAYRKDKAVLA